jgi:hypothetical protein
MKLVKTILLALFFISSAFAQDLKEFQQIIFCTPVKSSVIQSLSMTRVQEMMDDTMGPERIKFKLVYSDYVEVKADNQISDDIRIRTQNQASLVQILSAYFLVEFYGPVQLWRNQEHEFTFTAWLRQERIMAGERAIELHCQSRLSKINF